MTALTIANARIVDPDKATVAAGDIATANGVIVATSAEGAKIIDAQGKLVAPGIVDLGCFTANPPAFVAGGITRAAMMPDQSPVIDHPALVRHAAGVGKPDVWIHPIGAATRGLEGSELAEIGLMKAAGACAIATGRRRIADSGLMRRVLAYAAALDLLVIAHAEDEGLAGNAVATDGETATRLGLASAPAVAEALAIARDVMLAEETGARLHLRQVTTARGFDLVRNAKARGVRVTCGITPAHFLLSDIDIGAFRTLAKLSPPLRDPEDRKAALAAIGDGTIDVICSGHDPRGPEANRLPYADAEAGMSGAETLLPLALALVRDGHCDLPRLFALLSSNPARLLGLPGGSVGVGAPADLIVIDENAPWRIGSDRMVANAGNTPFDGLPIHGKILNTIKGGRVVGRA